MHIHAVLHACKCSCILPVFHAREEEGSLCSWILEELLGLASVWVMASSISRFHLLLQPPHPSSPRTVGACRVLRGCPLQNIAGGEQADSLLKEPAEEAGKAMLSFTPAPGEVG